LGQNRQEDHASQRTKFRIDFFIDKSEIIDKEQGIFRFRLVPDPRVWERAERNGTKGYRNKLDDAFISDSVMADMAGNLREVPITLNKPPGFESKQEYLEKSRKRLREDVQ